MPQESIREIRGWAVEGSLKCVRDLKTPSAMVERQILPRQTKRTETFLGESVVDDMFGVGERLDLCGSF